MVVENIGFVGCIDKVCPSHTSTSIVIFSLLLCRVQVDFNVVGYYTVEGVRDQQNIDPCLV